MAIDLDIDIGDVVLTGKFKNKRTVVKKIGRDKELNQPTINDKPLLKVRIEKDLPKDKQSKKTREQEETTALQKESTSIMMKLTKPQLKKLLREALAFKQQQTTDRRRAPDLAEIEAEVWGSNSPRADQKFVTLHLPKAEVENMTTEGLEQLMIEKFYEENGFGDDPFCNSLTVDGVDVQDYKDSMHLYEQEQEEELNEFLPPRPSSGPRKIPVQPSVRNKILELMISHMLYHHDHGMTNVNYWDLQELLADLAVELNVNEQDWLEQAEQNNPQAIIDLFEEAKAKAKEEIDAAWDETEELEEVAAHNISHDYDNDIAAIMNNGVTDNHANEIADLDTLLIDFADRYGSTATALAGRMNNIPSRGSKQHAKKIIESNKILQAAILQVQKVMWGE